VRPFALYNHDKCQPSPGTDPSRLLNLSVLLACRQIYLEAALLPFQKNTFIIQTGELGAKNIRLTFRLFLDHLAQKQRDALAQITITSTFCFLKYNKRQLARLKGLRTLHIIQEHRPNLGSMYDEISYGWKHAGGFPRSLRGVKLRRLQSVRFSLALRSPKHKRTASSEDAIVRAQTSALTRLLRLVEARLFYSLAGHPMPLAISEEREENGDCFEERLRSLRRSRSSTALR
jgi:hypothetical protein